MTPLDPKARPGTGLRRGALAVVADTFADEAARGRRVLVISDASPDPESLPGCLLVSFEEVPQVIAVVPEQDLLSLADRPCVTSDPRCCLLEPCPGCVMVLRAHLSQALSAAGIQGEAGAAFVRSWNEARLTARTGVRETAAQARAYAERAAEAQRPLAEVVEGRTVTAEQAQDVAEAGEVLLQEDAGGSEEPSALGPPPSAEEESEKIQEADGGGRKAEGSARPVEKKRVTRRRAARTAAPLGSAPPPATPPADGGADAEPLGAEAPAGPRGG